MGLLRASQQTREVVETLKILEGRRARFVRSGFKPSSFRGSASNPVNPPETPFPLSSTPEEALLRLALCCELTADVHETPGLGIRKSDLLSFAETLREQTDGLKSRPPIQLSQVAASAAWKSKPEKTMFVIHDAGFWNAQSRSIGRGNCYAVVRAKPVLQAKKLVPGNSFLPALRLILNARYPDSHHTIHVIIDGPKRIKIVASPRRGREEHPGAKTTSLARAQLEARGVFLETNDGFFRAF